MLGDDVRFLSLMTQLDQTGISSADIEYPFIEH
jgi:hypothetical protein